jgi:SAM-dependent methyltransferase
MAHKEQIEFCEGLRHTHPTHFNNVEVLDVGSLDINGNNRYLFFKSRYLGIDIVDGKNVDKVISCKNHLGKPQYKDHYDVIICTEMLEHDSTWEVDLRMMYWALRPGGLLLITAAGVGRQEHGTHKHSPSDSPGTNDYYRNVSNEMFSSVLPAKFFSEYHMKQDLRCCDFQFYGIKAV